MSPARVQTRAKKAARAATQEYLLRLYVAGQTPKCLRAFSNLKRICEEHLTNRYRIEMIDLLKEAGFQNATMMPTDGQPGVFATLESGDAINRYCSPDEKANVDRALACAVVGSPQTVKAGIAAFVDRHKPDELILTANVFDHALRVRSFELAMQATR